MKRILILSIFTIFIILSFLPKDAHAISYELQVEDSNGMCEVIGGIWDTGTNTCTINNILRLDAGDLVTVDSDVTLMVNGAIGNLGTINNSGTISSNPGSSIQNYGTINNSGTIANNSGGRIYNGGTINNRCNSTILGLVDGNSSINICNTLHFMAAQNGNWNDPATWGGLNFPITINSGDTVTIPAGITVTIPSGVTPTDFGTINNFGILYTNSGSTIYINSGGTITNSGAINNSGSIALSGGASSIDHGAINNTGTIIINSGGIITNDENAGSTIINSGGMINRGSITLYDALFNNNGTFNSSGTFSFGGDGASRFENGAKGILYNSGDLALSIPRGYFDEGGIINNTGTINLQGCPFCDGGVYTNGGVIFNIGGHIDNENSLFVNSASGSIINNGTLLNGPAQFGNIADITNEGHIKNNKAGLINNNDGAIITNNNIIDNLGTITNNYSGIINNSGSINDFCVGVVNNSGTITGNPVTNFCKIASLSNTYMSFLRTILWFFTEI